ncbi:E3 ubiquitin-protein ligase CCNB1IP1-like isoform X2 [Mercenaria mercenaria]|uniref:E3 ubiquitin-protein ligase CCNB1IP1-like isoform X2 n=1 Tax=Mercenaria mercenaria TaxID=6596 RepID=UPI00234EC745|nr:E3 ubiquitin-protein ligase CCNB1IP1-like isoform X2 [Mercenaria mercenaria]
MEGGDLICNFKKCRKRLTNVAYVTACSHVFCDEDGTREFNKSTTCPACQTDLANKFEIVRNNLQPSEQYKSMILAGLKPDVICEIASRAHAFWAYQSYQEKTYQEYVASKSKERCTQIEQYYEQIVSRTSTELNTSKKDVEETKKKLNEISDKLQERNRQHQKLQSMYDAMRRKFITMSSFEAKDNPASAATVYRVQSRESLSAASDHVVNNGPERHLHGDHSTSPNHFDFNPRLGHADSDIPANHVQKKFSVGLGTPRQ